MRMNKLEIDEVNYRMLQLYHKINTKFDFAKEIEKPRVGMLCHSKNTFANLPPV